MNAPTVPDLDTDALAALDWEIEMPCECCVHMFSIRPPATFLVLLPSDDEMALCTPCFKRYTRRYGLHLKSFPLKS